MTNTQTVSLDRLTGSVYGLAYGDAIGDPCEFRTYAELSRFGVEVPTRLRITDDTQMSLAVWAALNSWDPASGLGMLRMELATEFEAWRVDLDNNRAPGMTCLAALDRLNRVGVGRWTQATSPSSAGCGSVMRAPWIGLHPKVTDELVTPVAMLQAVLTHGPAENAYIAAAAAELTRALARGEVPPGGCSLWLLDVLSERFERKGYDTVALSNLNRLVTPSDGIKTIGMTEEEYVAEGVSHVEWAARAALRLSDKLADSPWGFDPCSVAGEGWRARECFAVAVGILDGFSLQPDAGDDGSDLATAILLRAAETEGDSDSIGAVTGALAGAAFGDVWPLSWEERLEARYCSELARAVSI